MTDDVYIGLEDLALQTPTDQTLSLPLNLKQVREHARRLRLKGL